MVRITAIRMSPPSSNDTTHIVRVKWLNPDTGKSGDTSRTGMADWIDEGGNAYVQVGSDSSKVITYRLNGVKYLRTTPDNTTRDNLLSLPRF